MNYIGSKLKLCASFIPTHIKEVCGHDLSQKVFCDIFAGTGIVGRTFKNEVKKVIANDVELYSFILNKNYIQNKQIKNQNELISHLDDLEPKQGFIFQNYSIDGGAKRKYFSSANGAKIDAIRTEIENLNQNGEISQDIYYFLLASLLESADKIANTASVYGAYLKNLKKSAQKPLVLEPAHFEPSTHKNEVFRQNANELIKQINGDILYLDPPYNARQYGANYHLLNTIAEYKPFIPQGKTGLRAYEKSLWCKKQSVGSEFENLIKNAAFKYIFLSYNNEGLLSMDEIKNIMSKYGRYDVKTTQYQRFKADSNRENKADGVIEYLHILEKF